MQPPLVGYRPPPETRPFKPWYHLVTLGFAVLGGFLGIIGAVINELRTGGFILLPIVGAPLIEEALKPTGIYIILWKWPWMLSRQVYTASLTAISGFCFGILEALVYVLVYVDEPPSWFIAYRFSLPIAMHTICSFIMGMGINHNLRDWAAEGGPFPKRSRNCYFIAAGIHSAFNTIAIVLSFAGVFPDV